VQPWETVDSPYRQHLESGSLLVHPWRLGDSTRQTSPEVEHQGQAEVAALAVFVATQGLPAKKTAVDQVRKPRAGVSALGDLWWQGVWHDGQPMALTPMWRRWVEEVLLPAEVWATAGGPHTVPTTQSQDAPGLQGPSSPVCDAPTDPEAGAGGPCGVASVGGGACPDLSAGLSGRRRSPRLSLADASQSSWLTKAPLEGLDRVA
jgi:hypothetical protein